MATSGAATGHADGIVAPLEPVDRRTAWWRLPLGAPLTALAAAGLAATLGAVSLTRRPLSTLEAVTVDQARAPLRDVLDLAIQHDPGQVGYRALLHPIVTWSDAEWAVRAPSLVAVTLSCLVAYAIGALLVSRLAGAIAALALALDAGVVASGQQARPVASALFMVLLATLALVLSICRSDWWWLAYVPACALLALTHPVAVSVLAAHACAIVLAYRQSGRSRLRAAAAFGLAVVAAAPLALAAIVDRTEAGDITFGLAAGELARGVGRASGWSVALFTLAVLGCVALAAGFARRAAAWKAALVIGLIVAPAATVLLADVFLAVYPAWTLVVSAPGLALACGIGVASIPSRWGALGATAALVALAAPGLAAWYAQRASPDWREAMTRASAAAGPGEVVLVVPEQGRAAARYYGGHLRLTARAYGPAVWVLVTGAEGEAAIEAARTVVPTPRYALLREGPAGEGAVLQQWVRP